MMFFKYLDFLSLIKTDKQQLHFKGLIFYDKIESPKKNALNQRLKALLMRKIIGCLKSVHQFNTCTEKICPAQCVAHFGS